MGLGLRIFCSIVFFSCCLLFVIEIIYCFIDIKIYGNLNLTFIPFFFISLFFGLSSSIFCPKITVDDFSIKEVFFGHVFYEIQKKDIYVIVYGCGARSFLNKDRAIYIIPLNTECKKKIDSLNLYELINSKHPAFKLLNGECSREVFKMTMKNKELLTVLTKHKYKYINCYDKSKRPFDEIEI